MTDAGAVSGLQTTLGKDPANDLWVLTEAEVLAEPTERRTRLIEVFAYWIVGIMAVGGLAAALTTMHSAIEHRTVEIGTLRAPTAVG